MSKEIAGAQLDFDAGKGRFLVLDVDGKKILQTHCWHSAKSATDNLKNGSCWRLSVFKDGGAVQVLP